MGNHNYHDHDNNEFILINSPNSNQSQNPSRSTINISNTSNRPTKEKSISIILPGFSFKYTKYYTFIQDDECCICSENYYDDMIMHMLPCNHVIHCKCLQEWFQKDPSCPICRQNYN